MRRHTFNPPDAAAMERLLSEHCGDPTGVVLRLAWQAGLTRDEIVNLIWDQVDFDAGALRLPDREVPLGAGLAAALLQWKKRCEKFSPYVAVSDRNRRRMAPQSLSNLARIALDRSGQPDVRLQDLRYDFIRRQFETHDWPYVLRVAGISVTTYRNGLARLQEGGEHAPAAPRDAEGEELRLWRIMQAERESPAGIALWLTSQLGLQGKEAVRLTWDQVDFDADALCLPDRTLALTQNLRHVLAEEKARRGPDEDPHVLLTPRSRKPLTTARLTTLVRTALIRGGIEDRSMSDFRRDVARERDRALLLDYAAAHGSVSRAEAAALLGMTEGMAYHRLLALAEDGELVRVNLRYYPPGSVVRPEGQREAVRALTAELGSVRRQDAAELLHIGQRAAGRLLKRMAEDGELVLLRRSKRYVLPEPAGARVPADAV